MPHQLRENQALKRVRNSSVAPRHALAKPHAAWGRSAQGSLGKEPAEAVTRGCLIKTTTANATGLLNQQHLRNGLRKQFSHCLRVAPSAASTGQGGRRGLPGPGQAPGPAPPPPLTVVTAGGGARQAAGARSPHGHSARLAWLRGSPPGRGQSPIGSWRASVTYLSKLKHYISCAATNRAFPDRAISWPLAAAGKPAALPPPPAPPGRACAAVPASGRGRGGGGGRASSARLWRLRRPVPASGLHLGARVWSCPERCWRDLLCVRQSCQPPCPAPPSVHCGLSGIRLIRGVFCLGKGVVFLLYLKVNKTEATRGVGCFVAKPCFSAAALLPYGTAEIAGVAEASSVSMVHEATRRARAGINTGEQAEGDVWTEDTATLTRKYVIASK